MTMMGKMSRNALSRAKSISELTRKSRCICQRNQLYHRSSVVANEERRFFQTSNMHRFRNNKQVSIAATVNSGGNRLRDCTNDIITYASLFGVSVLLSLAAITTTTTTTTTDCDSIIRVQNHFQSTRDSDSKRRNDDPQLPLKTIATSPSVMPSIFLDKDAKPLQEVDFLIIGHGTVGRSAAETLMKTCPNASIMVVDPSNIDQRSTSRMNMDTLTSSSLSSTTSTRKEETSKLSFSERILQRKQPIQFIHGSAISLNHSNQTVDIFTLQQQQQQSQPQSSSNNNDNDTNSNNMKRIRFRHSLLIATGVRASPPPASLIDERATERILEYRSTQLPSLNQFYFNHGMNNNNNTKKGKNNYPILSRVAVQQIALMAAKQNSKVCILGSGIEAIELAAAIAEIQREIPSNIADSKKKKGKSNSSSNSRSIRSNNSNVSLVFGGAAPLSNILPRYLSTAVSRRLRSQGIDIEDRSLVRYISFSQRNNIHGSLEVHLVKSFDDLDSKRCQADLLILAPSVCGQKGTAVLPSIECKENSLAPIITFKPWSKLCEQSVISCYSDDGRLAVNSELNAASKIYAAGSVAKYPNHITGHATVAGEGLVNGSLAGTIAARNMAKEYHLLSNYTNDHNEDEYEFQNNRLNSEVKSSTIVFSQDKDLPILRTDRVSTSGESTSSLSSLGIHALCVGQCDSENMSTHGFWWTNQSLNNMRMSRRLSNHFLQRRDKKTAQKPVYGSGVVFYLDRSATIRGVMIWGLPFSTVQSEKKSVLNEQLIQRIHDIIRSNGMVIKKEHKSKMEKLNMHTQFLSQSHLAEESKLLATIAMNAMTKKDVGRQLEKSRPLHRYIPSKPITVSSMGILKRHQAIGNGSSGDDIYERNNQAKGIEDESKRHPSLIQFFSYNWNSSMSLELENSNLDDDGDLDESTDNEIASRPPKEEPIWLRRNEVFRTTSMNDKMTDMFSFNLKRGQFYDGNDAVKQAPVPEFVSNARDEMGKWRKNGSEHDDGENNE